MIGNRHIVRAVGIAVAVGVVGSVGVSQLLWRAFNVSGPVINAEISAAFSLISVFVAKWVLGDVKRLPHR